MTISAIPPLPGVGALPAARPEAPAAGFADALRRGVQQVSALESDADAVARQIASGGPAEIHELMTATTQASLSVELLVAVRNRAVEAYQQIMSLQV